MKSIFDELGLVKTINASGKMTRLGVSTLHDEAKKAMVEGASSYVVTEDLYKKAGDHIAKKIGVAGCCIVNSASAGVALSIATLICGDDVKKAENFYRTLARDKKRDVLLLRGHCVDFGAPVKTMLEMGGANVIEIGMCNSASISDFEYELSENTLAIVFIQSHHSVQKGMPAVEDVIAFANSKNIPCIVDAAAEMDLSKYIKMGADMAIYSGAKAISGPTSGLLLCKNAQDADNARLQTHGIGRAMKTGKENIFGFVRAIELYLDGQNEPVVTRADLESFNKKISAIPGISAEIIQDYARPIVRSRVFVNAEKYGQTASQLMAYLQNRNPAIYVRGHMASAGYVDIDPRPLLSSDELNEIAIGIKDGESNGESI